MQAQVFEGYFDNGRFYNNKRQHIQIPEQKKVSITLFDEPISKKPVSKTEAKRPFSSLFGEWSGKIWMSDDFYEPLEDMSEYM
jgi:hypothetical protein